KLDGWNAGIDKDTSLLAEVAPVESPMTFAHGTLEFPKATTIADVQSVELSWTRNNDPVYAIGSRYPQSNVPKTREWNISVSNTYEQDSDFWETLLGASDGTSTTPLEQMGGCSLLITNGEAGAAMRAPIIPPPAPTPPAACPIFSPPAPCPIPVGLIAEGRFGIILNRSKAEFIFS
ncbi:unnamed protein product, partial [marine sediment metagenome]